MLMTVVVVVDVDEEMAVDDVLGDQLRLWEVDVINASHIATPGLEIAEAIQEAEAAWAKQEAEDKAGGWEEED